MSSSSRTVGLIAATNEEWVLGRTDGSIPWKHVGDQRLFAETTKGGIVIMGRVTWNGIPEKYRPLKDRTNIIISKTMTSTRRDAWIVYPSIPDALHDLNLMGNTKDIWFIGGRGIYEEALQHCTTVHLTMVPDEVPAADDIIYMPDNARTVVGWRAMTREHPYNEKLLICVYDRLDNEKPLRDV